MPDPKPPEEPPRYTRHRARPGFLARRAGRKDDDLAALNALRAREQDLDGNRNRAPGRATEDGPGVRDAQGRSIYRAGEGSGGGGRSRGRGRGLPLPRLPGRRVRRAITAGVLVKWFLKAVLAWTAISLAAFFVSATIHQSGSAGNALGGGGLPPFGSTTILVLGSDARPKGSKEPGAGGGGGPSRSDTMLLLRVGGGVNTRLSIPRDTVVDIPGHGRNKINAAYAFGGAELAVKTVEQFLGIDVNHLIEVNFVNFPDLVDAMGGVSYTGGCVVSRINGGFKNGGYTLRLKNGTTRIDGKQALALARTRKNECNPREDDTTRARRQQKLLSAMKSRVLSPSGFIRGPFIGWNVPKAIKSDMSAPTLLGVFGALATSGNAAPKVLKATPVTLPDGSLALSVSPGQRVAAVRRFLGK
ncbi:MAG: LytR family transcriptional regulator [Solirubrobacterales bacterium]|nr:LytR family transcriptional regulator [Solirubrobacterales bacterium]